MENAIIDKNGELIVKPSPTSGAADFNFLLGKHIVRHKKLKSRLSNNTQWIEFTGTHTMEALLNGLGNLEQHTMISTDEKPLKGIALRLFNPTTKLWSIHWADSNTGALDVPVTGSFENSIGSFYAKDIFNGQPILIKFKWDITDPQQSIWSQAFSADEGKTWEWNWHMYFSKAKDEADIASSPLQTDFPSENIGVIELRNYLVKKGKRDAFIQLFEKNFIASQLELKGFPVGQYRIKGNADNFCWLRGFKNMETRSNFLPAFYNSEFWKKHRDEANSMLANNDNVHLLRPVEFQQDVLLPVPFIKSEKLKANGRIAVVDFYTANTKLDQLIKLFGTSYLPQLHACGIYDFTLWISETKENDFPGLPVFQDKNLLVQISFYEDELEYTEKMKTVESALSNELQTALLDVITIRQTMILYPTAS